MALLQVRASAVALMGFSMRGMSTLADLEQGSSIARLYPDRFRAGIAFYPQCDGFSDFMSVPPLVLVGELDSWTTAAACTDMVAGVELLAQLKRRGVVDAKLDGTRIGELSISAPGQVQAGQMPRPILADLEADHHERVAPLALGLDPGS